MVFDPTDVKLTYKAVQTRAIDDATIVRTHNLPHRLNPKVFVFGLSIKDPTMRTVKGKAELHCNTAGRAGIQKNRCNEIGIYSCGSYDKSKL